jgi:membrane associated rhomboid family serine protease
MVSAAVGFQCPECVAEGRRSIPVRRTVFGGKEYARPGLITSILVGACVAVWLFQIAIPSLTPRFDSYGLAIASGEWWRLFTAGFLHLGIIHILFNMWSLWVLGRPLEQMLGRLRFGALYFVSLLGGSTVSYLFAAPIGESAGASGAIFGLAGGLIVVARRMRWNLNWLVAVVALNFLLPLEVPNIDWHAHVGGFIAGMIATAAFVYTPRPQRVAASLLAVAVLVAGSVGLIGYRTQQIKGNPRYAIIFQLGGGFPAPPDERPFP